MRGTVWKTAAVILILLSVCGMAGARSAAAQEIYRIESFEDLEALSLRIAEGGEAFYGEVHLMRDIEAECPFIPVGGPGYMFSGLFEGNGHVISGLHVRSGHAFSGLFGYIGLGGTVRNVTLTGAFIAGERYTGGIAGYSAGSILNCTVSDSRIHGKSPYEYGAATGGVVGLACGKVEECMNSGTKVWGRRNVGGIAGSLCSAVMENCLSAGEVFSWDGGEALAGGVVGGVQTDGTVRRCISAGTVYAPGAFWAGGIAGGVLSGSLSGCINLSGVEGREAGGVAGFAARRAQIMACRFAGEAGTGVGEGRQDGTEALRPMGRIRISQELLLPLIGLDGEQGV